MRYVSLLGTPFQLLKSPLSISWKQGSLRPVVRTSNTRYISRYRYHAEALSDIDENNLKIPGKCEVEQLRAEGSHLEQFKEKVTKCENILQYSFKDKYRCIEALNDREYLPNDGESGVIYNNNNRLAILGDILLDKYLCERWLNAGGSRVARGKHLWQQVLSRIVLIKKSFLWHGKERACY